MLKNRRLPFDLPFTDFMQVKAGCVARLAEPQERRKQIGARRNYGKRHIRKSENNMNSAVMRCFFICRQKESERDVLAEFLIDNPGNSLYYQKVSSA